MAETPAMFDGATIARVMREMHLMRLIDISWPDVTSFVGTAPEKRLQTASEALEELTKLIYEEFKDDSDSLKRIYEPVGNDYSKGGKIYAQMSEEPIDHYNILPSNVDEDEEKLESSLGSERIASSVYDELFPRRLLTTRKRVESNFPGMNDFSGEVTFLGKGNSGITFRTTLKGVPVVLKVSKKKDELANASDYHEWSITERLEYHPNVMQTIGLCPSFFHPHPEYADLGTTALVTPFQENGDLKTFLEKIHCNTRDERQMANIAVGMIQGIRSLHEQGVIHRDIALRNYLVDRDGKIVLCDFGLARFLPQGNRVLEIRPGDEELPWRWLAPESFAGKFSTASDIWMYGMCLLEIMTKGIPWPGVNDPKFLGMKLEEPNFKLWHVDFPQSIISEIIHECCQFNASDRPTADDVFNKLVKWQFREHILKRDENGNTLLHQLVSETGDEGYEKLDAMLNSEEPIMINAVNSFDETPLMMAKNEETLERLLRYQHIPLLNKEPSGEAQYHHNVDLFDTLLKLAEKEDVQQVQAIQSCRNISLFSKKLFFQRCGRKGETPLHVAARAGNASLVVALLALDLINAEKQNDDGQTALHIACRHGNEIVVKKLLRAVEQTEGKQDNDEYLQYEQDPYVGTNIQDNMNRTALHIAATREDHSVVDCLLKHHQVNVNIRDVDGRSPIFGSLPYSKHTDKELVTLQMFLKTPTVDVNSRDSSGETILHKIARDGSLQAAKLVLDHVDIRNFECENENGQSLLHIAIRQKNFQVANFLLSLKGLDINQRDKYLNTVLHILCGTPSSASASPQGNPTMFAIVSAILCNQKVNVIARNFRGETPLHVAARNNNYIVTRLLLQNNDSCVSLRNKRGETALHLAAQEQCVKVSAVLLESDIMDPNATDTHKRTALHIATDKDNVEIAAMLLASDVDPDARDEKGKTPLHCAAEKNSVQVAKMLLARDDVDPNARLHDLETPLHIAAAKRSVQVARLLLDRYDIERTARDVNGKTPLDAVAGKENSYHISLLKELLL